MRILARVSLIGMLIFATVAIGAPPNRIVRQVDARKTRVLQGNLHRLAQPQFDRGPVDPGMRMDYVVMLFKPSPSQQADLDGLLADQQNPSSPHFRQWLSPEEFGNRFGLSTSDQSKVVAWLNSEGFTVDHQSRAGNWIAFSGTAGQVGNALHTPIHRFQVDGASHFTNTTQPSVPDALADVVGGFLSLNDFHPKSFAKPVPPNYNNGTLHYLVPEDFATIYNVAPLYQAGIDGTGQSIAVVGESAVLVSDLRAFRTRYHLPANDPRVILYGTTDPGFTGAEIEGNLDLEWAGAIAPKATIYYVYGPSAFTAIISAVELNVAPIITISYGDCEIDAGPASYRSIAQQGNAQGITLLSASGDSGAAGCDTQDAEPFATRGRTVTFPAVMPEVTGVGGTQFVEGSDTYWATTNSVNFGSALSYIPEAAWNESATSGLGSTGGGVSFLYSKPAWQAGPGVPNDNARDVPDVALSASGHDAYYINYLGANVGVAGTSASAPSMAAIVALLNQYQVSQGFQKKPGLGNINPQLYRLAQSVPAAFHDVTSGDNVVQCAQGSPACLTGKFGNAAGPGYDMATGLGSVDANILITQWNTAANGVTVTLTSDLAKATLNDTIVLTATVAPSAGDGTPTGTVAFVFDTLPLGTVALENGSASVSVPLYKLGGTGTGLLAAEYSGDSAFSSGGATKSIQVTTPIGVAAIVPSAATTVWPSPPDAQGLSWQTTISLREAAGVPAIITGFTIDGQAQTLSQYFPSPNIQPNRTLTANIVFRNLAAPVTRTFGFTGVDTTGLTWSRQLSVNYLSLPEYNYFNLSATPLTVAQNTAADPSCQWPVQVNVDDLGGFGINVITSLVAGRVNMTSQIASVFGTTRLDAWGGLSGTLCFTGITPPASDSINVGLVNGASFNLVVSFAGPPSNPTKVSTSPAAVSVTAGSVNQPAQTTLVVNLSDKTQAWTASVYPANRTTSWLSASQLSGVGTSTVTLVASGIGFEPGVYRATIVIQCANAAPQYINVPVMFVLGGSSSGTAITAVANPATYKTAVSPGMLLSVFGTKLADSTESASGNPLPYSTAGVSATVNGLAAPVLYASPGQVNIQVPYAVGAGPAVLGINNNGQIAGFPFQISPASPGIFTDAGGNVVPSTSVVQGGYATLYVTGTGDVSPALKTAYSPSSTTTVANLPRPVLPLSVTVGGVPAFVQFAGIGSGSIGTTQVNILVPASVPPGNQPVVVTVGGISSPAANISVQAPAVVTTSQSNR